MYRPVSRYMKQRRFWGYQEHMQAPRKAYFQLPEENVHRLNEDVYDFPQVFFYGYTAILSA